MTAPLPIERSETRFQDYKLPLSPGQASVEANRCLFCADAPCIKACPTAIDIPQFIRKISTGNTRGSARTIFEANILGMSCARVCPVEVLCVGSCVYNELGLPPIEIGKLQRFATDTAFERGWKFFEAGPETGCSVGLIGAGPASLAAAHELRRMGHRCTIYEQRRVGGGLNATGVAPYKMRSDRSQEELDWILSIGGIDLRMGVTVGKSPSLQELEDTHDAVFVGAGLGVDARLRVPGEDLPGVHGAVEWIERMKLGRVAMESVRRAVVVGGGNTAVDAVRELLGLGVPDVTMLYRGGEEEMSGYAHEWKAAKVAGARAVWRGAAVEFCGGDRLERVRCITLDSARTPVPGAGFELEADLVLVAIGQGKLGEMFAAMKGIQVDRGRLVTREDGWLGREKWFGGGDCANGGKEVVNAAAEGKRAAHGIDAYLRARRGGALGAATEVADA